MVNGDIGLDSNTPTWRVRCGSGESEDNKLCEALRGRILTQEGLRVGGVTPVFMSKVSTMFECPQKYHFSYREQYSLKDVPGYLTFGATIHKAARLIVEEGLQAGLIYLMQAPLDQKEKDLAVYLTEILYKKLLVWFNNATILLVEKPLYVTLTGEEGSVYLWVIKPDLIVKLEDSSIWIVDYKTTAGYGAATANYYHTSFQTLTYHTVGDAIFRDIGYPLAGTKIIVLTKQGAKKADDDRVIIEDIIPTQKDRARAEEFMSHACSFLSIIDEDFKENGANFKFMTNCISPYGTCTYYPICFETNQAYIDEVTSMLFKKVDPNAHLFEEDV